MNIKLLGIAAGRGGAKSGAEDGPFALRQHGLVERLAADGADIEDLGDIPGVYETRFARGFPASMNFLPNILQVNRHTHACVLGTRRKSPGAFLLVIGGDHSLAIGVLAGLSDSCARLGLIWIDAHPDFNTPRSTPSGNIHGMSLAVACGLAHPSLRGIADRDPLVAKEDVVLLGCRDIDVGEKRALESSRMSLMMADQWRANGITDTLVQVARSLSQRCDHVHLSLDIDVLDPRYVPGTGTPVADGLTPDELRSALAALASEQLVHSAEIVEYNPKLDENGRTAAVTIDLITALV
ncbi:MAG: arginase [Phycisphaerales bacterium]|nr:arginase [Phycisphaerales bacterium]